MGIFMRGSSHVEPITPQMLQHFAPKIYNTYGYPGLRVLGKKSTRKSKQFQEYKAEIIEQSQYNRELVIMAMSNDWETLFRKFDKTTGKMSLLKLREDGRDRWLAMNYSMKAKYNHHHLHLLNDSSARYLKRGLDEYKAVLADIVNNSELTKVYHTSVLERLYFDKDEVLLEILFAVLNSYLETLISKIKLKNKFGQPVEFKFIRLTHQYHAEEQFWGFRGSEVEKWKEEINYRKQFHKPSDQKYEISLTHRSVRSTQELLAFINKAL